MLIHKAIEFAVVAHNSQVRKGTEIPYITHIFETAQTLTSEGASDKVIAAGLLHDTLEDTGTSYNDLVEQFGITIANLVKDNSEKKTDEDGNKISWRKRKDHTIRHMAKDTTPREARMICCADKLSNLRQMKEDYKALEAENWERFNASRKKIAWYYSSLIDVLSDLKDTPMYWELNALYKELFVEAWMDSAATRLVQMDISGDTYVYTKEKQYWVKKNEFSKTVHKGDYKRINTKDMDDLADAWWLEHRIEDDEWQKEYPANVPVYSYKLIKCENCGRLFKDEEMAHPDDNSRRMCQVCWDAMQETNEDPLGLD